MAITHDAHSVLFNHTDRTMFTGKPVPNHTRNDNDFFENNHVHTIFPRARALVESSVAYTFSTVQNREMHIHFLNVKSMKLLVLHGGAHRNVAQRNKL